MKLLIVDDHDLLRDALKSFIEADGSIEVMAVATVEAGLDALAGGGLDIVLLDYSMPGMDGFRGLEEMLSRAGTVPVALMSGVAPAETARRALELGAAGFLPKTLPATTLVNAVRLMAGGERYLPFDMAHRVAQGPGEGGLAERLTRREREVLAGLCEGLANKEIARRLTLSEPTIKLHVKAVCRKLDARNRTHAAILAKEGGFC